VSRYNSFYDASDNDIEILRVLIRQLNEDVDDKDNNDNVVVKKSQLE